MEKSKKDQLQQEELKSETLEENLQQNGEDELDEDSNIIELTDEDGVTTQFEYLTTIEYENNNYVVLMVLPQAEEADEAAEQPEDTEDEGEVVVLKIEQDEKGEDMYVSCEDEETAQKVFDLFMEQMDEEEDTQDAE